MIHLGLKLGDILVRQGLLGAEQLQSALDYAKRRGCMLGEALVTLRLCTETDVARALAEQNGLRFVDLYETPPTPAAICKIPHDMAVEYGIVPVRIEGSRLVVAAQDPFDIRIDEVVRKETSLNAVVVAVADGQFRDLLSRYQELDRIDLHGSGALPEAQPRETEARVPAAPAEQAVPKLDGLLAEVVAKRGSDLYLEPDREGTRISCRIDGHIHPVATVPRYRMSGIHKRLQSLTGADLERHGVSQAGVNQTRVEGHRVELRSTVMREDEGIFAAIRLVYPDEKRLPLESLGLEPEMLKDLRRTLLSREGMVVVAGPVGSGRPSTLHAVQSHLQSTGLQLLSLEAAFERKLTAVDQVRSADGSHQPTAAVLAMLLEQRPEAVLVPELPDKETAEIACRAAATGQLVLAGSLSSNAFRAMLRMMDLGVAAHQAAAALSAVLSQRLLRRVCPHCAEPHVLPALLEEALRKQFAFPQYPQFVKGRGCPECHGIGSRGCLGVFELLAVDDDLRFLLSERVHPSVVQEHLSRRHFRTLEEDAFRKACRGLIAPDELLRLGMNAAATYDELLLEKGTPEEPAAAPADPPPGGAHSPAPLGLEDLTGGLEAEPDDWEAVARMIEGLDLDPETASSW